MSQLTFESVNAEIDKLDLSQLEVDLKSTKTAAAQEAADGIAKVCSIWNKIGSIVKLIANFPLLPKKWRSALKLFIDVMDSLCPS